MNQNEDWEDTQNVDHYLQEPIVKKPPKLTYEEQRDLLEWWGVKLERWED